MITRDQYYQMLVTAAYDGTFPSAERSESGQWKCRYRTPQGKKCAIGLIIPDEAYYPVIEGEGAQGPIVQSMYHGQVEGLDRDAACKIQNCHDFLIETDDSWDQDEFVRRLNRLDYFKDVQKKEMHFGIHTIKRELAET